MKNIIRIFFVLLIAILPVNAMEEIDVDCDGWGWFNTDVCQDWELQDEVDTIVDGINDNEDGIDAVSEYITENEKSWQRDQNTGGGISFQRMLTYLMGDFITYLDNLVVTHQELVETTQLTQGDCAAAKVASYFSGEPESVGSVQYSPYNELGCQMIVTIA